METYEARLGYRVKDRVSGFSGIVIGLHRYLQGCDRMSVQSPVDENGKLPDAATFDAPDLIALEEHCIPYNAQRTKDCTDDVELADEVRDRVSGFKGIAVARHIFLNGCDRISVQPAVDKKGAVLPEAKTFDAPQLEVIERNSVKYETPVTERRGIGGPSKFMPEVKESGGRQEY